MTVNSGVAEPAATICTDCDAPLAAAVTAPLEVPPVTVRLKVSGTSSGSCAASSATARSKV